MGNNLLIIRSLIKAPIVLLGIITLLFGAGFFIHKLYQIQVIEPWKQNILTEIDVKAYTLAEQISEYFTELQHDLKQVTEEHELNQILASGNRTAVTEAQNYLLKKWPLLSEVVLLKVDEQYVQIPENFVASVLLRQSGTGSYPAPVATKMGGEWHVYIAIPILSADRQNVVGSLLSIFPADQLKAAIAESLGEENLGSVGVTEIRQTTKGFLPQAIFALGSNSAKLKADVPIKTIQGWQLTYTGAKSLAQNTQKPMTVFLYSLAGIVMLTIVLVALLIRYSNKVSGVLDSSLVTKFKKNSSDLSPEDLNKLVSAKLNAIRKPSTKTVPITANANDTATPDRYPIEVFRDYDIRGQAGTQITIQFAEALGKTLGSNAIATKQPVLAVAADGRTTSPELHEPLVEGILSTGCAVIDLGEIPTPMFNYGVLTLPEVNSGVIITASHNPASDNGFKIIIDQQVMSSEAIARLAEAMCAEQWSEGNGPYNQQSIATEYRKAIVDDVSINKPLRVVVDCANGILGPIAPQVLESIGCEVVPLYCEVDGTFPNHDPDPSIADNLKDLIAVVAHSDADLGLAFDGDGDRLVAISATGRVVWPDELLMIFARDLLSRQTDAHIVFDVKSTRRLANLISSYDGHPIMCKTGHSNVRRKIKETNAVLGGEYSGHIFFNDRWFGFDDGLYAATRLLEIMDLREQSLDEIIGSFEEAVATPEIKIAVPEDLKFTIIEQIAKTATFREGVLNELDGLRVEFPRGWGLIRASNTSASLTLRFEADSQVALKTIQDCFREQISPIIPDIALPF